MKDIEESVPDDAFLFCFDASKLYPSVPREAGMKACREALESRSASLKPTEYVLEMTEVVLDNNSFKLGNHNYKQTEGIAIGSRLRRNFACSYMRKCNEELLGYEEQSLFYKRFVDDGFGVWTGTLTSLQEFASYAKGIRPNIKIARRKLSFWIHGSSLKMVTYIPTLTRSQQTSNSMPPFPHQVGGLAYGLGLRIRRICEKEEDCHRGELKRQLSKRGYTVKFVEQQLQREDDLDRESLLKPRPKASKQNRVPMSWHIWSYYLT